MKILYFCPQQVWPATGGALLRNFHLANTLAKRCSVTLLQLARPGQDIERSWPATNFREILTWQRESAYTPWKILSGMLGPLPLTVLNYSSKKIAADLSELLARESFDAVQLESVHLLPYLDVIKHAPGSPAVIADWHNIESELMARYASQVTNPAKRLAAKRTAQLLQRAEQRLLSGASEHIVVSEREKNLLLQRYAAASIHVIANGVDAAAFEKVAQERDRGAGATRTSIVYVGSMDYHANADAVIWFDREIWPAVAAQLDNYTFNIVGRNPGPAVQALASNRVRVTGSVDDVRQYYAEASAVVVPLRVGGGTRLKILEAMAAGVPVISTALGAEGLHAEDDVHLVIANTPSEIASALVRVVRDKNLASRLSRAARAFVTERYDWAFIGEQLYGVYDEFICARNR